MKIRFWGVRGSIPTPGPDTVYYGGDTTCIEVRAGKELIIVDAGSGIRRLGLHLLEESRGAPINAHLLITHTHWDHIQGFPFFTPAYIPGNSFRIYGSNNSKKKLKEIFAGQMEHEYFPVALDQMAATLQYIQISEERFQIGDVQIETMFMNHPGIVLGYRIEHEGSVLVFTADLEPYKHLLSSVEQAYRVNGKKISLEVLGEEKFIALLENKLVTFLEGADLLIFDAAYTYEVYKAGKQKWGHSYPEYAVEVAAKGRVKCLALTHHDPLETDKDVDAKIEHTRKLIQNVGTEIECFGAQVGLEMSI